METPISSGYLQMPAAKHVSGYHMAIVAGVVFFVIRAALALVPSFATRHPIKKWSALAALLAPPPIF